MIALSIFLLLYHKDMNITKPHGHDIYTRATPTTGRPQTAKCHDLVTTNSFFT